MSAIKGVLAYEGAIRVAIQEIEILWSRFARVGRSQAVGRSIEDNDGTSPFVHGLNPKCAYSYDVLARYPNGEIRKPISVEITGRQGAAEKIPGSGATRQASVWP